MLRAPGDMLKFGGISDPIREDQAASREGGTDKGGREGKGERERRREKDRDRGRAGGEREREREREREPGFPGPGFTRVCAVLQSLCSSDLSQ